MAAQNLGTSGARLFMRFSPPEGLLKFRTDWYITENITSNTFVTVNNKPLVDSSYA